MSGWDHFDRILCINLEHRSDRLKNVLEQFRDVGLDGRVEIVKVKEPTINPYEFCSNGFYGNLLSHRYCINAAHQSGSENVLVFEDDVLFYDADYVKTIDDIMKDLPDDWMMLYLGCMLHERSVWSHSDSLVRLSSGLGIHAYAINKEAMEPVLMALDLAERLGTPADTIYRDTIMARGRCFMANPMVARQSITYSDAWGFVRDLQW